MSPIDPARRRALKLHPLVLTAALVTALPAWGDAPAQIPDPEERALSLTINALDALPTDPCGAAKIFTEALNIARGASLDARAAMLTRHQVQAQQACERSSGQGLPAVIKGADGADMLLIQGGAFRRGSDRTSARRGLDLCRQTYSRPAECAASWFERETPQRRIALSAFYVDKHEVTNAQYAACSAAGACPAIDYSACNVYDTTSETWSTGGEGEAGLKAADHPVACVTWQEAERFCKWAGKRLPTEAEWEKAARGDKDDREFPWGPDWEPTFLNWGELAGFGTTDGFETSSPVGAFPQNASPFGALDMAGNVWEWTADWRDDLYYRACPGQDPVNKASAAERIIRGGSWSFAGNGARTTYRFFETPETRDDAIGFRCAKTP